MITNRRVLLGLLVMLAPTVAGAQSAPPQLAPNTWAKIDCPDGTPATSPGLVWSGPLKRFVCFLGACAHDFKGERPYDVQSFDLAGSKWSNDLPPGATTRGDDAGPVRQVRYKTPYFEMQDVEGLVRPHPHHGTLCYQYAYAPWDGFIYALPCGHLVKYDPAKLVWQELKPAGATPAPPGRTRGETLCWSALCADPVNKEIVLFGGCGVRTPDGSPGTWVYATEKNEWRKLELKAEPGPRALSPMAYDPASKKIVLFGGERLDQLYADTWLYDCATRTWSEAKPPVGPSPRFGHALLPLPKAGKVLLIGGKNYSSSTGYCATLYKPLPLEMWLYDVARNDWSLLARMERGGPPQGPVAASVAAVNDDDVVLMLGPTGRYKPHETWACRIDASTTDAAGTAKFAVKPGTIETRTGSFDPEWYSRDVPAPDPAANEKLLADLAPNKWLAIKCPKWPENRQGGGWSTVTFDPDNDQILHMGGGHSSYFGNDMAHYDIKAGRWSVACRPQFALDFNYDLNGPGLWAFNGAPWGNHNYHAYAYDPTIRRVAYIKGDMTMLYDPATRTWPHEAKFGRLPFFTSKYVNYLCTTPAGVYIWTPVSYGSSTTGIWRLEEGKAWKQLKTSSDPLPMTVCDASTITYDSKRDRLLMTTTPGGDNRAKEPAGQVWACDLKTGQVSKLSPANMGAIASTRFARESVYLPKLDLVMLGYLLDVDGRFVTPLYDCAKNEWLAGELAGSEFIAGKGKAGSSVDLGLAYDAKRDLVWGVLCNLRPGALNAVRVVREGLAAMNR